MSFWREASSVILLTKSSNVKTVNTVCQDVFRILCVKRSEINSFLPNYTVFPGGATDKSDSSPKWTDIIPDCFGSDLNLNIIGHNGGPPVKFVSDNEPGSISKDLSLRVTAIRETFEESGVLLCRKVCDRHNTRASANHLEIDGVDKWRKLVRKNANNFIELCNQNNCYPDVGALHVWSNWLSPPILKTKFDTKFFIAFIESPVDASPDGVETSEVSWSTSDEMLSKFFGGNEKLVTPQYYELLRLKQFGSIDSELIDFARTRSVGGCEQVLPMVIYTKDGFLTLLPGDGKFDSSEKHLEVQYELDKDMHYFDSNVMHRLHHTEEYLPKKLIIKNYRSICGHILPLTTQIDCKL